MTTRLCMYDTGPVCSHDKTKRLRKRLTHDRSRNLPAIYVRLAAGRVLFYSEHTSAGTEGTRSADGITRSEVTQVLNQSSGLQLLYPLSRSIGARLIGPATQQTGTETSASGRAPQRCYPNAVVAFGSKRVGKEWLMHFRSYHAARIQPALVCLHCYRWDAR
jgi:hypothetical protein